MDFQCEVVERRIVVIAAESYEKSGFVVGEKTWYGEISWKAREWLWTWEQIFGWLEKPRVNECEKQTTEQFGHFMIHQSVKFFPL